MTYIIRTMKQRQRRTYLPRNYTLEQRFWANVRKGGEDECWLWLGSTNKAGYGQLTWKHQHIAAHRLSHELNIGPIIHRDVCHTCDNGLCVNPKHLFNGSRSLNMRDALYKGRGSQLILDLIEQGKATRAAKKARREARLQNPERDAYGRFAWGKQLPPRKRNARGHFM